MPYYGLYIPSLVDVGASAAASGAVNAGAGGEGNCDQATAPANVFREKSDALKVLKLHKDARLREFINNEDAIKYAQTGYEVVQTKYNDVKTSTAAVEKAAFRAPTKQELTRFRKMIEDGDYERVKSVIWDNPRYLVSSGDTPTILKEGCRYNAIHICAISMQPRIAELILQTVSNPDFVGLLTGKKNDVEMCKDFAANLLDLYLNIPEKVRSETPLHLASKYGAVEVVEVLTSYPECKMTENAQGCLPIEIVGSRLQYKQWNSDFINKIHLLLRDGFYVPVIRSMDNTIPPQVGNPFSANNPPNLQSDPFSPELKIQALAGPMDKEHAEQFCRRWKTPPRLGSNNASSPVANFISPVKIRTPGKSLLNRNSDSPTSTLQRKSIFNATPQRLSDKINSCDSETGNGIHPIDQEQTDESSSITEADKQNGNHSKDGVPTSHSTVVENKSNNGHTGSPLNVGTNDNQQRLNSNALKGWTGLCLNTPLFRQKKHLFSTYRDQSAPSPVMFEQCVSNESFGVECDLYDSPGFKERHIKITDHEKGLEIIGRNLAQEQFIEWKEYWDFLDEFIDIRSSDGLQKLENFFTQRIRKEEIAKKASQAISNTNVNLGDVCSALEKFGFSKDAGTIDGSINGVNHNSRHLQSTTNTPTTPYTCVEKSLQVFAKRMTKTILNNIDNIVSINDAFFSELKRMKSLICSFKDDSRFIDVDFAKVHSRFANLIANYLQNSQDVDITTKNKIQKCIQHILLSPGERKEQLHCVCQKILVFLEDSSEQILPEHLKTEAMCSKVWFDENVCNCQWEANLSRKTSRRNRMETRYRNHQQAKEAVAAENQRIKDEKKNNKTADGNVTEWRDPTSNSDSEAAGTDEEVFWSDFGSSDMDEDECWLTPPESLSRISLDETESEEDKYNVFIYGNEPTKRDLDVLNAILHIYFTQNVYPNLYNWKQAVMRHLNDGIDNFPSPAVVKKTHSFTVNNSNNKESNPQRATTQHPQIPQLPIPKRLFMSPSRPQKSTSSEVESNMVMMSASSSAFHSDPSSSKGFETKKPLFI